MTATRAHAISLPIFYHLATQTGVSVVEMTKGLRNLITALDLEDHIEAVIVVGTLSQVELNALTSHGIEVLRELKERTTLPPCPEGECDFDGPCECRWCGRSQRLEA